jgi:hypothetical protein
MTSSQRYRCRLSYLITERSFKCQSLDWRVSAKLRQIGSGYFDFAHVVVVEELVLAIVPFDPHARPIAGTCRALIVRCHAKQRAGRS